MIIPALVKLGFEEKKLKPHITKMTEIRVLLKGGNKMFLLRNCKFNRIQPYEWSFTVPYKLLFMWIENIRGKPFQYKFNIRPYWTSFMKHHKTILELNWLDILLYFCVDLKSKMIEQFMLNFYFHNISTLTTFSHGYYSCPTI